MALLPSLARLHLTEVAPDATGMNQSESGPSGLPPPIPIPKRERSTTDEDADNSSDSDDDEPLSRRAERKVAKTMPAAEVLRLFDMPRDLVPIIITQAGTTARESPTPARDICEWMKTFCRTAKVQGVPCEDVWYWHALTAFGFAPNPVAPTPAFLAKSAFQNWRDFFSTLCEAFYGLDEVRLAPGVVSADELRAGTAPVWNYVKMVMGQGHAFQEASLKSFLDPNASQRVLDTLIHTLMTAMAWKLSKTMGPVLTYASLVEQEIAARNIKLDELRNDWRKWESQDPRQSPFSSDRSPWMAVVTLLLLRGGMPWTEDKWKQLDMEFGELIGQAYDLARAAAPYPGAVGPLSERDEEGTLAGMNFYLDRGANINIIARYPAETVLDLAVEMQNEAIMKLLLDRGATIVPPRAYGRYEAKEFVNLILLKMFMNAELWTLSQETTERLIAMVKAWMDTLDIYGDDYAEVWMRIRNQIRGREGYTGPRQMPSWMMAAWQAVRDQTRQSWHID